MMDYVRLGVLFGVAIALVGNFATSIEHVSPANALLVWLCVGAGVGALIGVAMYRASLSAGEEESGNVVLFEDSDTESTGYPRSKFYAVSRTPSSTELRALMVDSSIPGENDGNRLQLIVESYDDFIVFPNTDEALLESPLEQIAERAREAATNRVPDRISDPEFVLTYLRSEGPLDDNGRSPAGWTFRLVDGLLGIQCQTTLTRESILLNYWTAVSYPRVDKLDWLDPVVSLDFLRNQFQGVGDRPLYLRSNLPKSWYLYDREGPHIFLVDSKTGEVIGSELLKPLEPYGKRESIDIAKVRANWTEEEAGASGRDLETIAEVLFSDMGPDAVDLLFQKIMGAHEAQEPDLNSLIQLLARVPSSLALGYLYKLSSQLPGDSGELASKLLEQRRHWDLGIFPDPIEAISFEDTRALLGKTGSIKLGLRSTYNPESEFLPVLDSIGLVPDRIRLLSGDTELFLAANFKTADQLTEGLLTSSPLPVPCHVLTVLGPEASSLAGLVRVSNIYYSEEEIREDVLSGRPGALHRGALYLAALEIDAPETFEVISDGAKNSPTNPSLRRACLAALSGNSHPDVEGFLKSYDNDTLNEMAQKILKRRQAT